jgi:O-methyltransferase involved in polyketide biosynthesis
MVTSTSSSSRPRRLGVVVALLIFISGSVSGWTMSALRKGRLNRPTAVSRGFDEKYGTVNNSTIPTGDEVASLFGVQRFTRVPNLVWKFVWRTHGRLLPLLHLRDRAKPKDADQSLKVMWNKAIAALDVNSPTFDAGWTYDFLPSSTRWILKYIPTRLFPRLHHANIEIRTAYLNQAIQQEIGHLSTNTKVRIIALGSGYDSRYTRLLTTDVVQDAWELDIASVLASKKRMVERLQERRANVKVPHSRAIDLNDVASVKATLQEILNTQKTDDESWHTIFVSEAVFIYLDEGIPIELMKTCRNVYAPDSSFCFADLLRDIPSGDRDLAEREVAKAGWKLVDWQPKPGLARHMGVCR